MLQFVISAPQLSIVVESILELLPHRGVGLVRRGRFDLCSNGESAEGKASVGLIWRLRTTGVAGRVAVRFVESFEAVRTRVEEDDGLVLLGRGRCGQRGVPELEEVLGVVAVAGQALRKIRL